MFKQYLFLSLLLFTGCTETEKSPPISFTPWEHNPILRPGDSAAWDNQAVQVPFVTCHDSVFYLFYTGFNTSGTVAIGLATSTDGYHFTKLPGNPVLAPGEEGFDSYTTGAPVVIKNDSIWIMYYNASDVSGYGPGPSIGRAISQSPAGPWKRDENPVLTAGNKGEWDYSYIIPSSIISTDNGNLMMYYSGGDKFGPDGVGFIGMATSQDGIHWKKYNNPETELHPYKESDPILGPSEKGQWDDYGTWSCCVYRDHERYRAIFGGTAIKDNAEVIAFGFATSADGIHWIKDNRNPFLETSDDPYLRINNKAGTLEFPSLVFRDSLCFLYYDYGNVVGEIGMAVGFH